ncbi:hypothetical protein BV20DRAFT_966633 [Pilatotrama ljubarskyi]|nr:hypothetical protein BV20DRAFT_966633 [Pilatotrama ljubarskyi]
MLSMQSMHRTSPYDFSVTLAHPEPNHAFGLDNANFLSCSPHMHSWSAPGFSLKNTDLLDLPFASKPYSPTYATWDSVVSLDTYGDDVVDPNELPQRRPSPIGSRRRPRSTSETTPPRPTAPTVPTPPVASMYTDLTESAAERGRSLFRPSSAPPVMQRKHRPVLQQMQEVEEPEDECAAGPPQPLFPLRFLATAVPAIPQKHDRSDCQGDPLCATHRTRPARLAGAHLRKPFDLWDKRPKLGEVQCDDFECIGTGCRDCAYLHSRGGALWSKIVRPLIEDRLDDMDLTSVFDYAEEILPLVRLRATLRVRRRSRAAA